MYYDIYVPILTFDSDGNPIGVYCAKEMKRVGTTGVWYHCLVTAEQIALLGSSQYKHPSEAYKYMSNANTHCYFGRGIQDKLILDAEAQGE